MHTITNDGLITGIKETAWQFSGNSKKFHNKLQELSGANMDPKGIQLFRMDGQRLAFQDEVFDGLVSVAVLEHVSNIQAVATETRRLLRHGGIAIHVVHLFPSLSGSHEPYWTWPHLMTSIKNPKVEPWDHLRQQRWLLDNSLNRLRMQDYIDVFRSVFSKIEFQSGIDVGSEIFLTPQIRAELNNYTDSDLLTRELYIICYKE